MAVLLLPCSWAQASLHTRLSSRCQSTKGHNCLASHCPWACESPSPRASFLNTTDQFGRKYAFLFVGFWQHSFKFLVTIETLSTRPNTLLSTETGLPPAFTWSPRTEGLRKQQERLNRWVSLSPDCPPPPPTEALVPFQPRGGLGPTEDQAAQQTKVHQNNGESGQWIQTFLFPVA